MSYIDKDQMIELHTAAEALETSLTAEDTIQLRSVAYAINTAANTGATRCMFQEPLRDNTKKELASNGYHVTYVKAAKPEGQALISWSSQPSVEGPEMEDSEEGQF